MNGLNLYESKSTISQIKFAIPLALPSRNKAFKKRHKYKPGLIAGLIIVLRINPKIFVDFY